MTILPILVRDHHDLAYLPLAPDWGVCFRDGENLVPADGADARVLLRDSTDALAELARTELVAGGDRRWRLELQGHRDASASLILIMPLLLPSLPIVRPVVAIGIRERLLVCDTDDFEGVARMRRTARALFEGDLGTPVTPQLQSIVEGAVVPF